MIFNKTGRLLKNHKFVYKNSTLECVREYKYLGFIVTPSGEVRTGLEDLRRRALRALAKMKNTLGALFRHDINNTIHIYNYLVKPILTYCSDYWGCIQPKNNPVEKVHLMFCKYLLGVRKQINTEGVLQELGMAPLALCAIKSVTKNWERVQQKKANQLLISSNMDAHRNNLPWVVNIRKIFSTNGMLQEYLHKLNETEETRYGPMAEKLYQRMRDQFNQISFDVIKTSSKMKMLNLLKTAAGRETYLTKVTKSKHRVAMTKLRLSGHRLEIETGRYRHNKTNKTDAEERYCKYCEFTGQKVVEDEIHFLIRCPMLNTIRVNTLPSQIVQDIQLSDKEKFSFLMTDNAANNLKKTAKYIYQAFDEREIKLDVLHTLNELVSSTENLLKKTGPGEGDKNKNVKKSHLNTPTYTVKNISQNGLKLTLHRV